MITTALSPRPDRCGAFLRASLLCRRQDKPAEDGFGAFVKPLFTMA
jgi:hypothetical protein